MTLAVPPTASPEAARLPAARSHVLGLTHSPDHEAAIDLRGGQEQTGPRFGPATGLTCRECAATYGLGDLYSCQECFGPLEVSYDFGTVTRAQIEAGPASIWRYAPLLPVAPWAADEPNLAPGFTKLVEARNLARELGITQLTADVLAENQKMLTSLRAAGYAMRAKLSEGILHFDFSVEPTEDSQAVMAATVDMEPLPPM